MAACMCVLGHPQCAVEVACVLSYAVPTCTCPYAIDTEHSSHAVCVLNNMAKLNHRYRGLLTLCTLVFLQQCPDRLKFASFCSP